MLYDLWRQVASRRRQEWALRDIASGQCWTFGELLSATDGPPGATRELICAQGQSADFIFQVLRAWRTGGVLCPLEPGQSAPVVPLPPESCVHLKTTSATTGAPRLIAFTADQLLADVENIRATMGLRPDWPNLGVVSLAHSYGFSNLVLPLLLHGVPLILVPSPLPEMIRRAAAPETALTWAGVPALWRAAHEAGAIPPNVRLAISAGAPLSLGLEQIVFDSAGLKIHNFYGSSECGGIAYDAARTPRADEALVGLPMRNVQLALAESGCLEVRGRNVGETYWPEASDDLRNGCFRTSDLVELRHGQVCLRGRVSDLINVAGRKVSPVAIERILSESAVVRDCLVFGMPSPEVERGDVIVACVVATSGAAAETLKQFALERLPSWQVPRAWWFVESLTADQRGKISRAEWRRRFQEEGRWLQLSRMGMTT